MKQNQISDLPTLETECFENMFNVYKNEDGIYYYNLLQTIVFPKNLPQSLFTSYVISYGDTWPLISHKNYDTPNLWWIILFANEIQDPTKKLISGQSIKIPVIDVVKEVLSELRK
jgi:hypothetical protein